MSLAKLYIASSLASLTVGVLAQDVRFSNATLSATTLNTMAISESYKDPNKVLSIALTRVEGVATSIQRRFFKADVLGVYGAAYLAELTIGSGSTTQKVDVLLDTGSFELWVNPDCEKSNVPSFCQSFGRYDPSLSPTAVNLSQSFDIRYGSGSASGPYYTDDVFISGAKIVKQQFGVANKSDLLWFGVMGLAHGRGNGFINYDTVVDSLAAQGFTNSKLFSLDLGSQGASAGSVVSGEMVFGGVDKNKYAGNLSKVPTDPSNAHYTVQLAGLAHRPPTAQTATPLPGTFPVPVIVDSGTTLSLLPKALVEALVAQFPGASNDGRGGYRVPCSYRTQPGTVTFSFAGGVTVNVAYAEFIWNSGNDCYLGAWNDPAVSVYILGDTFLRGAYVVFDQDSDALFMADYVPCNDGSSDLVAVPVGQDQAGQITGNCVPAGGAGGTGSDGSSSTATLAGGALSSSVTALDPSANPPGPASVTSSPSTSSSTQATAISTSSSVPATTTSTASSSSSPGLSPSSTTNVPTPSATGVTVSSTKSVPISSTTRVPASSTTGVAISSTTGVPTSSTTGIPISSTTGVPIYTTRVPTSSSSTLPSYASASGPVTVTTSGLGVDPNTAPVGGSDRSSSSSGAVSRVTTRRTVTSTITNRTVYTVTACQSYNARCTVGQLTTSTSLVTTTFCPDMEPTPYITGPALPPGVAPANGNSAAPQPNGKVATGAAGVAGGGGVVVTVKEQCHTSTFAVTSCAPDAGAACTVGMSTTATYTLYRTVTEAVQATASALATVTDSSSSGAVPPPVAQVGAAGAPGTAGTPGMADTAGIAGTPGLPGTPGTPGTVGTGPAGLKAGPYSNDMTSGAAVSPIGANASPNNTSRGATGDSGLAGPDVPSVVAVFPEVATDTIIWGTGTGVATGADAAVTGILPVMAGAGRAGMASWAVGLGAALAGGLVGL